MYYYDDYEPDYDSLDYHGRAGYEEALAEEGLQPCYECNRSYDWEADHCPNCYDEDGEPIEHPEGGCYACHMEEPNTEFMGQPMCWACYQAVAKGNYAPDRLVFADPGGNSALRAAGPGNPRVHPCPNCYEPNRLTPQDKARGYQCDTCADRLEHGGW